jgi:membrane associated rhomboid family serine protease
VLPLKDNIPTRRFPVVTVSIIAICCFVYFILQKGGISGPPTSQVVKFGAIPYEITNPGEHCQLLNSTTIECAKQGIAAQPATWLTVFYAMFMHGSLLHIGGNMLFLWIFGNNVEDSMGRVRFAIFYILGGLVATGAHVLADTGSTVPTLGASGAIAAVLGGYAVLYPRARVLTLIFIIIFVTVIELPALVVLGLWFLLQIASASAAHGDLAGSGVAYYAHIGGFVFGLLLIRLFAKNPHDDYQRGSRIPVY